MVGTPGRIMDHMDRRTLDLSKVSIIVLDEADEMLDMGFRDDIEKILSSMPNERQTVFFSATMPKPILELTRKYQTDPEIIKVLRKELTVENISQLYFEVRSGLKTDLISRLINLHQYKLSVIFCNTKRVTDEVTEELTAKGVPAEALHGDLSQAQRTKVMNKFRKGHCSVLVATDVAARGIDVENVEAVFNFDLPLDEENYVHRIGRTGRAGKSGTAISFVSGRRDAGKIRDLERFIKTSIDKAAPPSVDQLIQMKRDQLTKDIHRQLAKEDDNTVFEQAIESLQAEGLSLEQIALSLVKMQLGEAIDKFKEMNFTPEKDRGGRDDRRSKRDRGDRGDRGTRGRSGERGDRSGRRGGKKEREPNMARLFLNLGKKDRIRPNDIVGAIAGETGVSGGSIGEIDIYDSFSFVDIPKKDASHVINVMNTNTIKGKQVNFEISKP